MSPTTCSMSSLNSRSPSMYVDTPLEDKSEIYAESCIPEYWFVNLVDDVLE